MLQWRVRPFRCFEAAAAPGIKVAHRPLPASIANVNQELMRHAMSRHPDDLVSATAERDLYIRVHGEFGEMPGLTVTVRQAARLFNIEQTLCERVLGALVDEGALAMYDGKFARPGGVRGDA
jgi:hypothetical protein